MEPLPPINTASMSLVFLMAAAIVVYFGALFLGNYFKEDEDDFNLKK